MGIEPAFQLWQSCVMTIILYLRAGSFLAMGNDPLKTISGFVGSDPTIGGHLAASCFPRDLNSQPIAYETIALAVAPEKLKTNCVGIEPTIFTARVLLCFLASSQLVRSAQTSWFSSIQFPCSPDAFIYRARMDAVWTIQIFLTIQFPSLPDSCFTYAGTSHGS